MYDSVMTQVRVGLLFLNKDADFSLENSSSENVQIIGKPRVRLPGETNNNKKPGGNVERWMVFFFF